MAGAGTRLFVAGEVLTAAQVNTYLQDQVIMVFADSASRDAAFGGSGEPVAAEGMFCFLKDTDTLQYYSGSAWTTFTSGISPTTFNAKGDLLSATGNDAPAILSLGSNGQYLKVNTSSATGLEWGTISTVAGDSDQIVIGGQVFS